MPVPTSPCRRGKDSSTSYHIGRRRTARLRGYRGLCGSGHLGARLRNNPWIRSKRESSDLAIVRWDAIGIGEVAVPDERWFWEEEMRENREDESFIAWHVERIQLGCGSKLTVILRLQDFFSPLTGDGRHTTARGIILNALGVE